MYQARLESADFRDCKKWKRFSAEFGQICRFPETLELSLTWKTGWTQELEDWLRRADTHTDDLHITH